VATQPQCILIVDDDDTIAVGLAGFLRLRGCEVEAAHDFETARSLVERRTYAIAVVDIVATGHASETGMAFLQWLRDKSPETLVIVLTAYRTAWLEHFALDLGVTLFLDKPKSFDEIANLVADRLLRTDVLSGERG
jgi:DNA-binding NtrC family response regulator